MIKAGDTESLGAPGLLGPPARLPRQAGPTDKHQDSPGSKHCLLDSDP